MDKTWIKSLPKMDLHCHLDGSIRPERIKEHFASIGEALPEDFGRWISVGEDCPSLTEYLRCFDLPNRWLQSKEALAQAVVDLLQDARAENTRYIEIRFAPTLHLEKGLTYEAVFSALEEGRARGEAQTGVVCRFIVCAMRHHSMEQNLAMLEAAAAFHPQLVCAADLAGDENAFPTSLFIPFFHRAKELGVPYTIHSGETGNKENIRTALELDACRLGHGIAMLDDPELMARCRAQGVGVELCPSSNFQTKAAADWDNYPMKTYLDAGLCVSLNTDNRTVSRTDQNREYDRAMAEGGASRAEILQLLRNGCRMSFAPEELKASYLNELKGFE